MNKSKPQDKNFSEHGISYVPKTSHVSMQKSTGAVSLHFETRLSNSKRTQDSQSHTHSSRSSCIVERNCHIPPDQCHVGIFVRRCKIMLLTLCILCATSSTKMCCKKVSFLGMDSLGCTKKFESNDKIIILHSKHC